MADNFQSQSQQYDDDAVGTVSTYYPPTGSPLNQVQEEKSSRPDQSVKACKNICVIFAHDLSGSMMGSRNMIANGTNEFLQDLKSRYAPPCEFTAKFCLITFAGDTVTTGEWTDVHNVPLFNADSFVCNGTTPLWDACATGIDKMNRDCEGCTAALYVFTDGDNNNSKKANRNSVRDQVSKLNTALHTMLFIGSDPFSSAANANAIGVTRTKSLNPSSDNTPSAMRACTNTIARCVTGETQTPEFNDDDIMMSEGPSAASAQSYDMVMGDDGCNDGCNGYVDDGTPSLMMPPTISRRRSAGAAGASHDDQDD